MSMSDIHTDIRFGATVAVSAEEIRSCKTNILSRKQEKQAMDFGVMIMENKGWHVEPRGDMIISSVNLYVFTPNELRDFLDAKIKDKLIQMSERDSERDIADRLIMLSERV